MALDNFRAQQITWDKASRKIYEDIRANESDARGRKLVVQVTNDGVVETLSGVTLILRWKSKNGTGKGYDNFTVLDTSKGLFELYYTTGMLSNVGVLEAFLELNDATGRVISEPFDITVTKGIDDSAIEGSDSFTALAEAMVTVSAIHKKVGGGVKAKLEDLSPEVLSAIDGSGGPFNLLSIPQEKSVGVKETKYLMAEGLPSKNIFTGWEKGAYDWSNGKEIGSVSKIRTKELIKVKPNEYIWIDDPDSQGSTSANAQTLFEFTEDKTFIKFVSINTYKSRGYLPSATCHYVGLQSQDTGSGSFTIGDFENYRTQVEHSMYFTGYENPCPKTKPIEWTGLRIVDKKLSGVDNTISKAVTNARDSVDTPATIQVISGVYNESVYVGGSRNISIIGMNKHDCIIKTTTGNYNDAPLEMAGNGYVANMTFIASYDVFPSVLTGNKAYALHIDYAGEGVIEFENCNFKSSVSSALGLGTHNNQKIIFKNCTFESDADPRLTYSKYGAAFLHASTNTNATGQRVEFHNCVFRSSNETVMWIADVNGSSDIEVGFYNCLLWSDINGKSDSVVAIYGEKVTISPDSYGNNVSKLNK